MIETDDCELLDCTDADSEDEGKPRHGPVLWPWLVLLGLITIVVGAIGAMAVG
jgi:hypothetical protein